MVNPALLTWWDNTEEASVGVVVQEMTNAMTVMMAIENGARSIQVQRRGTRQLEEEASAMAPPTQVRTTTRRARSSELASLYRGSQVLSSPRRLRHRAMRFASSSGDRPLSRLNSDIHPKRRRSGRRSISLLARRSSGIPEMAARTSFCRSCRRCIRPSCSAELTLSRWRLRVCAMVEDMGTVSGCSHSVPQPLLRV